MNYSIAIKTLSIVEVEANSEEQALEIVKNQLDAQDPRNNAKLSIVKEIK